MPMIDLTLPQGALAPEAKEQLVEKLTAALIELEGAPDNEHIRAISWCFVDERQEIHVGGRPAERPVYRVVLTVPEGAPGVYGPLAVDNRERLVKRVTAAVLEAEGTPFSTAEAGRVWVQLRQVADGHWGGFGELVRMPDIAAYGLGVGPEDGKGLRIRAAFDAARSAEPVSA